MKLKKAIIVMTIMCICLTIFSACHSDNAEKFDTQNESDSETTYSTPTNSDAKETVAPQNANVVEDAYNTAISLTKKDLTGSKGNWMFKSIKLLSEDCEWIDSSLNTKGTVNQGAIYRKMAMLLEGFQSKLNKYTDYSEILLGFTPSSRDEFIPYADNAMTFIVTTQPLKPIMQALENVSCVSGEFDYEKNTLGVYDFTITDLSACAKELKISEEMLGYTLAMLSEYAPTISFENNSCHIKYESMKKEILPLGDDDFVAEFPSENKTENILDVLQNEYGEQSFYYTFYDASVDASKEDVIKTNREIHIGDTKQSVIDAYGDSNTNTVLINNSVVYQEIMAYDAAMAGIMRTQCITYVSYSYGNTGSIEFYFDENDLVSWIIFYLN